MTDIVCNYTNYYEYNCALRNGDVTRVPTMHCGAYGPTSGVGQYSCSFQQISGYDDFECVDVNNECAITQRENYNEPCINGSDWICNGYRECYAKYYCCNDGKDCEILCSG